MSNDRAQNTLNNIARGVEVGAAGLGLLERIIALFRPKPPEEKAKKLRTRAETKRETAATAKNPKRRKRLLSRADKLEDKADKIAPAPLVDAPTACFEDTQSAGV